MAIPDGDAGGSVDQKVRNLRGKDRRLLEGAVVVGEEIDRVLVQVLEQFLGQGGHANLCVPGGGRRVPVDGTEVPLPVHERVAEGKILGEPGDGVVDGHVSVGVVLTYDVSHDTGRFLIGLVVEGSRLVKGEENPPVNGLQPVPNVWDSPSDDDAHGVAQVGDFHLRLDVDGLYVLIEEKGLVHNSLPLNVQVSYF